MTNKFVDSGSFIFAGVTFLVGVILFYHNTEKLMGSVFAALLAAALSWIAYVLMRWVILALKR